MQTPSDSCYGYKIVDKGYDEVSRIIQSAIAQGRPLEVGIYFGEPGCLELFDRVLASAGVPINAHLDHRRVSAFKAKEDADFLRHQIDLSQRWGADYAITHISPYPFSRRLDYQDALFARLLEPLRFLNEVATQRGFPIHIENTFHDLPFYRRLFDLIRAEGLEWLHFCFDIGHAKVWSNESLVDWLRFVDDLRLEGRLLHFHLHGNSGVTDEHLSFIETEAAGHGLPDAYTGELDLFAALRQIHAGFPLARKIFEVPPQSAEANLDYVLSRILD